MDSLHHECVSPSLPLRGRAMLSDASPARKNPRTTTRRAWTEVRDYTLREIQSREALVSALKEDVVKELVKLKVDLPMVSGCGAYGLGGAEPNTPRTQGQHEACDRDVRASSSHRGAKVEEGVLDKVPGCRGVSGLLIRRSCTAEQVGSPPARTCHTDAGKTPFLCFACGRRQVTGCSRSPSILFILLRHSGRPFSPSLQPALGTPGQSRPSRCVCVARQADCFLPDCQG